MFRSLVAFVAVSDAARIEHHLNIETNVTKDHGGNIRVGDGSRCLAVYGKNIHARGEVTIFAEKCKYGAKHQMWKHENGALKSVENPGKCLDIFEDKCGNGQNLILWKCNGQQNQKFYFIGNKLKSTKCANCVDVDMDSNIKNVLTWQCGGEGKVNQKMDWNAEWKGSLAEQEETAVEEADDAVVHRMPRSWSPMRATQCGEEPYKATRVSAWMPTALEVWMRVLEKEAPTLSLGLATAVRTSNGSMRMTRSSTPSQVCAWIFSRTSAKKIRM
jgi:hypothetical protein